MKNIDIRNYAKENKVYIWQIASKIKISEATLIKKLRYELPDETKARIYAAIDELVKERETSCRE